MRTPKFTLVWWNLFLSRYQRSLCLQYHKRMRCVKKKRTDRCIFSLTIVLTNSTIKVNNVLISCSVCIMKLTTDGEKLNLTHHPQNLAVRNILSCYFCITQTGCQLFVSLVVIQMYKNMKNGLVTCLLTQTSILEDAVSLVVLLGNFSNYYDSWS